MKRNPVLALPFATIALVTSFAGGARAELIRHWPFDNSLAELVASDDGTAVGDVTFAPDRDGNADSALSVDGSLFQYVSVAGGGGLNALATGTVAFWVKWSGLQDGGFGNMFGVVLARQNDGLWSNHILGLSGADPATATVLWRPYSPFVEGTAITGGTAVGDGEWHHVAVTFTDGEHKLYLDGVLDGTGDAAPDVDFFIQDDIDVPLGTGAWYGDGASYSTSMIDDLKVFDTVLSEAEVQALLGPSAPFEFAITDIVHQGGGSPAVTLTFNSVSGGNYAVDFATTLLPNGQAGGWQELTDSVGATGNSTQYEDTFAVAQGFPNLFYRVRDPALQPAP